MNGLVAKVSILKMNKITYLFFSVSFLLTLFHCGGSDSPGSEYRIAVIPKGTTHSFWRSIHAGAVKAERELIEEGIQIAMTWKGPLREDDREQQIQVVEGFLSQGMDGIVLAPLDDRALVRPVEEALNAGIPTVIIDSALDSDSIVSFVATNNAKGGELAAQHMAQLLEGKGKVLMLRYQEGSASTRNREEAFVQKVQSDFPEIDILSADQYAGPTRDTAKRASENLLNRYGNELDGIFCVNETSTVGMLLALQDIDKAGKVVLIGFDANEILIDAMRQDHLQGLVVQNPFLMGYLGVQTLVEHLIGKPVANRVDTGVVMVTPERLDDMEIQDLIYPPMDQYLE